MKRSAFIATALAAVMAAPSAAAQSDEVPRTSRRSTVVAVEGAAYGRSLYGLSIYGGEAGFALGWTRKDPRSSGPEVYMTGRYALGWTEERLRVHVPRTGAEMQWVFGPVRVRGSVDFMWMAVERASNTRGIVQHWGLGLSVGATLDILGNDDETSKHALFVGPRLGLDLIPHKLIPRTYSPFATFAVGYRF